MHSITTMAGALALGASATALGGDPGLTTEVVAEGLVSPIFATHAPEDPSRIFILERDGRIRVVRDGALLPDAFLDLTAVVDTTVEGGLLGLAFDPDYAANGRFFVHYTTPNPPWGLTSRITRFERSAGDPDAADPASEFVVLEMLRANAHHVGASIDFSPVDGFLYVALGDSGWPPSAQTLVNDLNGKILRLDVSGADDHPADPLRNYAIPPANPFVGVEGDDEIWAYGVRNPYRCSFDRATGDYWIGEVGDVTWEEIDLLPATSPGGENLGWDCAEGTHCHPSKQGSCACADPTLTAPVVDYDHTVGCAVTGGVRYRGCAMPEHEGRYFYSDFCSCNVFHFRYEDGAVVDHHLGDDGFWGGGCNIVGIGEDYDGEILVCSLGGTVSRIVPVIAPPDSDGDGIPDTCETLPEDLDGDGVVGFADLLQLLSLWGPCAAPCPGDFDDDGAIGFADLLRLLSVWSA